jgi:hypothetical protein
MDSPEEPKLPKTVEIIPLMSTIRMTELPTSAIKIFPKVSPFTSTGSLTVAEVAGILFPIKGEFVPLPLPGPAKVIIIPFAFTRRIQWLRLSAINKFPMESM